MPRLILFFFFSLLTSFSNAQITGAKSGMTWVMLYRSKDDSIRHLLIEKNIDEEIKRSPLRQAKIDSLMELQRRIYMEGRIMKTIYRPGEDYVITDSLESRSDLSEVRKVCVYNKKEIPKVLLRCRNLEAFELVNTSIKKLPRELNALTNLKTVYIYENRSRNALRLGKNNNIQSLIIRSKTPKGLPRSFRKFQSLTKLDLAENLITKFPNGARHNKKLKELSLQRNALTLKGKIKKHPYLETLSLHENQISDVPASIKNCSNLTKLNFNSNKIKNVNAAIGFLKKLEQVSFYNNQLTSIPKGLYQIRTLKEIDLFHNQIDRLDPEFCNWHKLQTLYLSHNRLTQLPENIDTLKTLTGLYLWDNRLGELPENIGNISELKYLRVNHNYLKEIPASLLRLQNLEELDLSHNYINEAPVEIFDYPNLKILAMVNNPWNQKTLKFLHVKAEELRRKNVFVHISDEEEKSDN